MLTIWWGIVIADWTLHVFHRRHVPVHSLSTKPWPRLLNLVLRNVSFRQYPLVPLMPPHPIYPCSLHPPLPSIILVLPHPLPIRLALRLALVRFLAPILWFQSAPRYPTGSELFRRLIIYRCWYLINLICFYKLLFHL